MRNPLKDRFSISTLRQISSLMFTLAFVSFPIAYAGQIKWEELNLTPQQANHIERLETDWEKERAVVTDQIARDKAELKALLPNGDRERIKFLQRRITHNEMYLMNASLETFLEKRDVLEPDQRSKLQRMMPGAVPASTSGAGRR